LGSGAAADVRKRSDARDFFIFTVLTEAGASDFFILIF
jgi:hypothetical protein